MARVKIEGILDHLSSDLTRALEATLRSTAPQLNIDGRQLYRQFVRNADRRCGTWEQVPDDCVEP